MFYSKNTNKTNMSTNLENPNNLNTLWEICIYFLWDEKYITGLEELFRANNIKTILDCAGGTGFPSVLLYKNGWDITYSDGDKQMYAIFLKTITERNLAIPNYLTKWQDLRKNITKKYDAVLCRGNSLIYVDSWKQQGAIAKRQNMQVALENMYAVLKPGGLLYVDTIGRHELKMYGQKNTTNLGTKNINGHQVQLSWTTILDTQKYTRTWLPSFTLAGKQHQFALTSYLLTPDELQNLLSTVGFTNIREVKLPGENWYTPFVAQKPI